VTEIHESKTTRCYEMLLGVWMANNDKDFLSPDTKTGKSNENVIADQIIAPCTWHGSFNKGWYSLEALENMWFEKKGIKVDREVKNQIDHIIKTKQVARMAWDKMQSEIKNADDFISFLEDNIKLCTITKKQNKDMDSRDKENPVDRYKHLGIDFIYVKKSEVKKIMWSKITFDEFISLFDKHRVEDILN